MKTKKAPFARRTRTNERSVAANCSAVKPRRPFPYEDFRRLVLSGSLPTFIHSSRRPSCTATEL